MLPEEYEIETVEMGGEKVGLYQPVIKDSASPEAKNILALRRYANRTGHCAVELGGCGARKAQPNRATRRAAKKTGAVILSAWVHEDHCPTLTGRTTAKTTP
ncbi:hypothetical protein [Streptomyces sp. AM 3-1-1]|uniref:hypothetical protein n=1 Tax=Streptomyces sp. AM 3-1-1 TaxID=3028711 RepID=UPI0023B88D0E|nr:hypothetical protein [Streptomyces sp. AM 3-1-1]WEH30122.1 hypothetical protein P0D76_23930 [Streptomyces sp. AM 3-1-1]